MRRPIIRSNRGGHQNSGTQLLLPPIMSQLPSTSTWNASALAMAMPMATSNDMSRMANGDMFLNFNGFNVSSAASQFMSSAPTFNFTDEPSAVGRCIFNLDGMVIAGRRDEPTISFAYDGQHEGQLSRPWGVCVDKGKRFSIRPVQSRYFPFALRKM